MWASKIGSWAAAGAAAPRTTASARSRDHRISTMLSRRRRTADAAGAVPYARGVVDRREDDPIHLGHPLLVGAAPAADDPRARAADERGRRALEPEELGLHLAAERIVTPRAVTADDAVAGHDHRHGIGAECVADGARGPRVAHAPREGRVRVDLAERNTAGFGEHAGLEVGHAPEVDRHREERPATGQILAQLPPCAFGVDAGTGGSAVNAAPRAEPRHASLGRLDPEPVGQRFQVHPLRPGTAEQPRREIARSLGSEELFEHDVDAIHGSIPPALASGLPCPARADS